MKSYNNRGFCYSKPDDDEKALADIRCSLELDAGNSFAYKNMETFYLDPGNKEEAKRWFLKALRFGFTEKYGPEVSDLLKQIV